MTPPVNPTSAESYALQLNTTDKNPVPALVSVEPKVLLQGVALTSTIAEELDLPTTSDDDAAQSKEDEQKAAPIAAGMPLSCENQLHNLADVYPEVAAQAPVKAEQLATARTKEGDLRRLRKANGALLEAAETCHLVEQALLGEYEAKALQALARRIADPALSDEERRDLQQEYANFLDVIIRDDQQSAAADRKVQALRSTAEEQVTRTAEAAELQRYITRLRSGDRLTQAEHTRLRELALRAAPSAEPPPGTPKAPGAAPSAGQPPAAFAPTTGGPGARTARRHSRRPPRRR